MIGEQGGMCRRGNATTMVLADVEDFMIDGTANIDTAIGNAAAVLRRCDSGVEDR